MSSIGISPENSRRKVQHYSNGNANLSQTLLLQGRIRSNDLQLQVFSCVIRSSADYGVLLPQAHSRPTLQQVTLDDT